jgi:hypothetical protein
MLILQLRYAHTSKVQQFFCFITEEKSFMLIRAW